ncbi:cytochrome c biogenesis protein CcsA [Undibacterium sp. RTI2.1]|uniref:cytochrome C assembly family protein n=1 Tax=unclassified Undibacterium TaxID=2630295 RepID=UPI002AB38ED0|nr:MULTISPECIES: cytochrome c biogenesis protein CcsA [unclassified Undibacterium]MDY7540580.1 cytochrome c biogenesis protein CcsA [Undibacterium sp. 5I1]MEB0029756.1 cytochrome c biogenesis protein CcsA [Undibacterium sp. RTI2.1]MEB0118136.1 cytochrome c biogenesis protein CcsA [Undibacterium sp. RTI2.2]MEB0231243.1 cytochrome c biogenesis protein CcsA [Undibacterium sp. 10I3]MEB0256546.1 cytochrome c biogenesis protein CcsA [Undibacterium sp. 5I1]
MQTYLPFLAAALYIACSFIPGQRRLLDSMTTIAGWLVHAAALYLTIFMPNELRVGFAVMLSAALWVSVFVYWLESRNLSLDGLKVLLLPNAAIMAILPVFFPGSLVAMAGKPAMFPWHIAIALLSYSTLTIAAFHAVVMTLQDAHLHKQASKATPPWLSKAIERLPALLMMEKILFRLVAMGFVLLTLTVLSGIVFSEEILGVAFKWDHKTILSLFSWMLFGILLIGRHWRGWRGKTVLSFTLSGFLTLLLAYVGSRFVLEVILHRSLS